MDSDELRELLTPEALTLLDGLPDYGSEKDVLAVVSRLRKEGHPPGLVATVLTQSRLRQRARLKFGDFAKNMLFTPAGLEQASRLEVAATHAGRFRDAGCRSVADLGCGLGADAMALGSLDVNVLAVERDPITAALAAFNLSPFPTVEVRQDDAENVNLGGIDGVFLDPARRTEGHENTRRRLDVSDMSPSWTFALDTVRGVRAGGIKVGPGMDRDLIPADAEAQWVACGDEVVEMALWFGACRRAGISRSALVIGPSGRSEMTAETDSPDVAVGPLGSFLYEPNGAVIRARLVGDLARSLSAHMLHPDIAYVTTDDPRPTPFARGFEILESTAVDHRSVSRALAEHGIGRVEIKKRGLDIDPATFRTRLRLASGNDGVVILTRVGSERRALIARRID